MQNITIICVGKLKEKYLKDAACEYAKRLSSYCKLNIVEIDEERLPDRLSENVISAAMEKEAERIEEKIPAGAYTIALCIEGKQLSSQEFSTIFEKTALEGFSNLAFIIGGSFGLAKRIKHLAKSKISFSSLTFPHQLFRVMLLEQIYRAFQIRTGGKYHK